MVLDKMSELALDALLQIYKSVSLVATDYITAAMAALGKNWLALRSME